MWRGAGFRGSHIRGTNRKQVRRGMDRNGRAKTGTGFRGSHVRRPRQAWIEKERKRERKQGIVFRGSHDRGAKNMQWGKKRKAKAKKGCMVQGRHKSYCRRPHFLTPIIPKSSEKKTPLALHAAEIIRDQLFLVLPTVPSEIACTSNYHIKTNEKTYVFSRNNTNHKSNNIYKCFKTFVSHASNTFNQKIQ